MDLLVLLTVILILLFLIVQACTLFTNAIEWAGRRFNLSEGAVGSVLAAVGTALPETLVPIVALLSAYISPHAISSGDSHAIGIGAILGAPFLLSTLAMFVTGMAVLYFARQGRRTLDIKINRHLFIRDFHYFFAAYIPVLLAAFIGDHTVKQILAVGLVMFYGFYVYRTIKKEHVSDEEFDMEPLIFSPKQAEPLTGMILFQVLISLLSIIFLAHLFVEQISEIATKLSIDPLIISLIICPIATELPEKFNSVVWIKDRKDVMAYGNITGAMVFQSTIPTAIGLMFTPWVLHEQALLSVALCLLSSGVIYFLAFKWMHHPEKRVWVFLSGGLFYLIFLIAVILPLLTQ